MSLTDTIAKKLAGAVGWLILKELRRIASALERGVDSSRELAGAPPLFAKKDLSDRQVEAELHKMWPMGDREATEALVEPEGDFLRLEILELLAHENSIPLTTETDLVALGKARGWLDHAGQVVVLPKGFGE